MTGSSRRRRRSCWPTCPRTARRLRRTRPSPTSARRPLELEETPINAQRHSQSHDVRKPIIRFPREAKNSWRSRSRRTRGRTWENIRRREAHVREALDELHPGPLDSREGRREPRTDSPRAGRRRPQGPCTFRPARPPRGEAPIQEQEEQHQPPSRKLPHLIHPLTRRTEAVLVLNPTMPADQGMTGSLRRRPRSCWPTCPWTARRLHRTGPVRLPLEDHWSSRS
jgi:hypothetical protein